MLEWNADDYSPEFCAAAMPGSVEGASLTATEATVPGAQNNKTEPVRQGRSSIGSVIEEWRVSGPLVHEPTGISALDELTGGGPVYGSRWYLAGAPDAGKTALLVQIAHVFSQRGVTVGLLAVDEDPEDIVTRFAQRVGFSRSHCEIRDPIILDGIAVALNGLAVRLYDSSWTIEAAAADLHAFGKRRAELD